MKLITKTKASASTGPTRYPLEKGAKPDGHATRAMLDMGGDWFAYQNQKHGDQDFGHLEFLMCGPNCPNKTPPNEGRTPGYVFVGRVILDCKERKAQIES